MWRASTGLASVVGVVVAAVVMWPEPCDAQAKTAAQVLADVQKTYAAVTDMSATIQQEVTNVTFGSTKTVSGQVWLRRPGKMRWDYAAKPRKGQPPKTAKSFVSDGTTLWIVELENQQIIKTSVKDNVLPVAVAFLSGTPTWSKDFRARLDATGTYGAAGDQVVVLTPKRRSAQYKKLFLVVDATSMQVKESIVVDAADNTNHFTFTNGNLAATNHDSFFVVDETSPALAKFRVIQVAPPANAAPATAPTPRAP